MRLRPRALGLSGANNLAGAGAGLDTGDESVAGLVRPCPDADREHPDHRAERLPGRDGHVVAAADANDEMLRTNEMIERLRQLGHPLENDVRVVRPE